MKFPLPDFLNRIEKIKYLHECPLCLGVWVYAILAFFMQMSLLEVVGFYYVPFVSELITGGVISWMVYIFILGFRTEYDTVVI